MNRKYIGSKIIGNSHLNYETRADGQNGSRESSGQYQDASVWARSSSTLPQPFDIRLSDRIWRCGAINLWNVGVISTPSSAHPFDDDFDLFTDFEGLDGVGVIVDVFDFSTRQLDDDVAALETRFGRRPFARNAT